MTAQAFLRHLVFCLLLAALSAAVVYAMVGLRLMDRPDPRKAHTRPTPKSGGLGIVLAFLAGIFVLHQFAEFSRLAEPYFRGVILASILIAAVSLADDIRDFPFTVKLAAQLAAALAAVTSGLYVDRLNLPYFGPVELGPWGPLLTLVWILFATNAMNFIDGMNGLAAGTALVACGFLAAIAASQGGWFVYFAAMLLGAGLVGFLPFNYPRARIFMGDVGSQFCGFILAMLAVAASRFDAVPMSFLLVPLLLSGVLFDVLFTLVRRLAAGDRVTAPHQGHLYQVARRGGGDPRLIAALYWLFAVIGGVTCLAFAAAPSRWKPLLLLAPLPVQLIWLAVVIWLARRARLGRW